MRILPTKKHPQASIAILATAVACAGPKITWDPKPAPSWVAELLPGFDAASTKNRATPKSHRMYAVGQAPATLWPSQDHTLALQDAKAKLAQRFQTQITSTSYDWARVTEQNGQSQTEQIIENDVQTRSQITLDEVRIEGSFRDMASTSQYVRISIDKKQWRQKLETSWRRASQKAQAAFDAAQAYAAQGKPFATLSSIHTAEQALAPHTDQWPIGQILGVSPALLQSQATLHEGLKQMRIRLKQDPSLAIALQIDCANQTLAQSLRAPFERFLAKLGLALISPVSIHNPAMHSPAIQPTAQTSAHINLSITNRTLLGQTLGNVRQPKEAAGGSAHVYEGLGQAQQTLWQHNLSADHLWERAQTRAEAIERAQNLAGQTLLARFRQAFRKRYP